MTNRRAAVALTACAALLCFLLRATNAATVFAPDGTVALDLGDAAYHARLSMWIFENFPSFLRFDPYLVGPQGGLVPWPPLFDWLVAAIARAFSTRPEAAEVVLAWNGPVMGVLTVAAVFLAARALGSDALAVAAAFLYASFGTSNTYGLVGNGDHHAFVALLGALWLAAAMHASRGDLASRARPWIFAGLSFVGTAMLLGWNGSALYLGVGYASLGAVLAFAGDWRRLACFGLASLGTASMVWPLVAPSDQILGGAWSSLTLSWLHVAVCGAVGVGALALAAWERAYPTQSWSARAGRLAGLVAVAGAAAAVAVGSALASEGLAGGLRFLTMRDAVGARTVEQAPIFSLLGRRAGNPPQELFGWWVYGIVVAPIAPIVASWKVERRPAAFVLALWSACLLPLAITQMRFANDLAAPIAICFAVMLREVVARLRLGGWRAAAAAAAIALAAASPTLEWARKTAPAIRAFLAGAPPARDPLLATTDGTLIRFAQQVRAHTPETDGYLAPDARPAYGIFVNPNFGHTLRHYARRPVPIDNFWDKYPAFTRLTGLREYTDESRFVALLEEFRQRYVVTTGTSGNDRTIVGRLAGGDGFAVPGGAALERFRLVLDGPRGGRPIAPPSGPSASGPVVAFKLFELVAGAVLAVEAPPGSPVEARIDLVTPAGRSLSWTGSADASDAGVARIRVPYPTEATAPVHATGPCRIVAKGGTVTLAVTDEQVRSGAELYVQLRPAAEPLVASH